MDRVSSVLCRLDTSVREGDHVLTKDASFRILRLTLLEAGLALLILYPILVPIRLGRKVFYGRRILSTLGSSGTGRSQADEEDEL